MKKTVLTFGFIAGAILSVLMVLSIVVFNDAIGFDRGEIVGYTSMVVAFLLIFFGVRTYRDTVAGGTVSFGRALAVGGLIALVASACYVATWEVIYFKFMPKARADGKSEEAIAKQKAETDRFLEMYKNPVFNVAMTFLEPLPVAVIVALVSAGVLSRRKKSDQGVTALESQRA
jgi:hypothetical protein